MPDDMATNDEKPNAALLRDIVAAYTTRGDAIEIVSEPNARGELLKLRVDKGDHAKVVGGGGKQIQALRTIFQFIGARDGQTLRLVLLEPDREGDQPWSPPKTGPFARSRPDLDEEAASRMLGAGEADYDPEATLSLLDKLLARVLAKKHRTDIYAAEDKVHLEIYPHADEATLAEALATYAAPIFHAIGKRMGRDLYLEAKPVVPI